MRFKTASCFEALLQIWDTWSSNRNIKSIFIAKRVTLSSHLISAESILKEVNYHVPFPNTNSLKFCGICFHKINKKNTFNQVTSFFF